MIDKKRLAGLFAGAVITSAILIINTENLLINEA